MIEKKAQSLYRLLVSIWNSSYNIGVITDWNEQKHSWAKRSKVK